MSPSGFLSSVDAVTGSTKLKIAIMLIVVIFEILFFIVFIIRKP